MKSTRRLSIEEQPDQTVIRYQWCQTFARYALILFLALAVTILITDHAGRPLSFRIAVELTWAAMVLGLIFVLAVNSTELRVTSHDIHIRCMPLAIYPQRTLPRDEIRSVHHWLYLNKGMRYKLAIQSTFAVRLGTFDTRDEARLAAEAICKRHNVDCRETPPIRGFDLVHVKFMVPIVALLAAPWIVLLLLEIFGL